MTGFCLGGALSLMSASLLPSGIISAAAPFYGIPGADKCDLSAIAIPVQGHFGETDMIKGFSSLEDARNLETKCSSVQLWVYKDCGHAFVNPSNPNFSKENADLALGRLVEFMNKNLV